MKLPLLLASAALIAVIPARAATLSVANAVSSANGAVYNISGYGALDWAVWEKANATDPNFNIPTNSKLNAVAISNLYSVGGGTSGYRASTSSAPDWDFTFTDGSAGAGTVVNANGVFHPDLASSGKGLGLTVTLPTTSTYVITLFVAGYDTTSRLTASLAGVTTPVQNTSFSPAFPTSSVKRMAYFTITATADNPNDVLDLQFINTGSNASSHVIISAVAVQIIPEPAAAGLAVLSAGLLGFRRRRIHP